MLLRSRCWRLHIGTSRTVPSERVTAKTAAAPRQRRFGGLASSYGSLGARRDRAGDGPDARAAASSSASSASAFPPMGSRSLGRAVPAGFGDASHHPRHATPDQDGFVSQRARHRRTHTADGDRGDDPEAGDAPSGRPHAAAAGSLLSPLPKKYGFYDGLDAHALAPPTLSRDARRDALRQALEPAALSVLELTDETEADMDLGGLPASEYHGQAGWTTISTASSLYHNVLARDALESRQRANSWSTARRRGAGGAAAGQAVRVTDTATSPATEDDAADGEGVPLSATRRVQRQDDGQYNDTIEGELLAPVAESIGQPRSVYAMRKLFVQGLVGYQGIVSRAEESAMAEELLRLLQDPRAAYVAEETRYCVNLYERELGLPGKDTLAFALANAPTLQRVLQRFFLLGLIPSIPNVCQVSEMTGNFSGYPVHRKPSSIGSYFGILNLVSTSMLYMQHVDCPWYPRVHMAPRSLFVFSEPCLSEYKTGYKWTHQPFHTFDYATRVSKDYRIEVMFATVEVEHQKHLAESVQLTDYAAARVTRQEASPEGERTDAWLQRLREQLHASEAAGATVSSAPSEEGEVSQELPLDGHKLREILQARHVVGRKSPQFALHGAEADAPTRDPSATSPSSSTTAPERQTPAQRRLAALKERHALAEAMRERQSQGRTAGHQDVGPRLIRGHAPADGAGKL